jgi:hypothetical protein
MSSAGSSDGEFDFAEVAAPSDGEEAADDESLSSALKLLAIPAAAEAAPADAQPGGAPGARAADGRLEARARRRQRLAGRQRVSAGGARVLTGAARAPRCAAQVLDDFVRNFLRDAGLSRTLEQFETEWYEVRRRARPAARNAAPTLMHAPCAARCFGHAAAGRLRAGTGPVRAQPGAGGGHQGACACARARWRTG